MFMHIYIIITVKLLQKNRKDECQSLFLAAVQKGIGIHTRIWLGECIHIQQTPIKTSSRMWESRRSFFIIYCAPSSPLHPLVKLAGVVKNTYQAGFKSSHEFHTQHHKITRAAMCNESTDPTPPSQMLCLHYATQVVHSSPKETYPHLFTMQYCA